MWIMLFWVVASCNLELHGVKTQMAVTHSSRVTALNINISYDYSYIYITSKNAAVNLYYTHTNTRVLDCGLGFDSVLCYSFYTNVTEEYIVSIMRS
jgi:YbbR domain-containing protein